MCTFLTKERLHYDTIATAVTAITTCDLVTTTTLCTANRVHNGNSCSKSSKEQKGMFFWRNGNKLYNLTNYEHTFNLVTMQLFMTIEPWLKSWKEKLLV